MKASQSQPGLDPLAYRPCSPSNGYCLRPVLRFPGTMAGSGRKWPEVAGSGRKWPEVAGSGRKWPEVAGSGRKWPEVAGSGRKWPEVAGSGRKWPEVAGSGRKWPEVAGSGRKWPEVAGSGRKWPEVAGSGRKWPEVAGSGRKWPEKQNISALHQRGKAKGEAGTMGRRMAIPFRWLRLGSLTWHGTEPGSRFTLERINRLKWAQLHW